MSRDARHNMQHTEYNFTSAEVFDMVMAPGRPEQIREDRYEEDSDFEDTEVVVRREVMLRSFDQLSSFAAFHKLRDKKAPVDRACQGCKILESGEVCVLVPPLKAVWFIGPQGYPKTFVYFSWAVVTANATVRPRL